MDPYRAITAFSEFRPSWGTLIIVLFVLFSILITVKQGKGGAVRNILSVFMSLGLINFLPLLNFGNFSAENYPAVKAGLFLILFGAISFSLSRSSFYFLNKSKSSLPKAFFISLISAGLLISVTLSLLPPQIKQEVGGVTQIVFLNEYANLIWEFSSILFIILIG